MLILATCMMSIFPINSPDMFDHRPLLKDMEYEHQLFLFDCEEYDQKNTVYLFFDHSQHCYFALVSSTKKGISWHRLHDWIDEHDILPFKEAAQIFPKIRDCEHAYGY